VPDARSVVVTAAHPLDMLRPEEVTHAIELLRAGGHLGEDATIVHAVLDEPDKAVVTGFHAGDPVDRAVRVLAAPGAGLQLIEAIVSVSAGQVREVRVYEGMRPALLFGESLDAILKLPEHPEWVEALNRRGITDMATVQIDPWPAGNFGLSLEEGRRISRCIAFLRDAPTDNGYAKPIEGLVAFFDMGAGEVIEVQDRGIVPIPPERGGYLPDDVGPMRTDLRALEITQPDGPSFEVDGNAVRWQRWSFRVAFDPYEGLVLHTVDYHEGGRARPVLYRASISEMVVPYGDPGPGHGWKNAFDAGEWGLGRMANSLTLGCDCLGAIHYFDGMLVNEQGVPYTLENAICMHEEDYGILWKHHDLHGDTSEVRRSRRLVVSLIATVGNYEYGFYWYFYLDGNIQLEVKLTGIVSTMAIEPGTIPEFANVIAPGLAAPHHQHLFNARLDLDVDGATNTVYEVEAEPIPTGPDNPWGNAFRERATRLATESTAQRDTNGARSRHWRIVNPTSTNRLDQPVGYRLLPTMSTPTMLAQPDASVAHRAAFALHNLWVTPYEREERRAAGEFPNQHAGDDGLPRWTSADREIADRDVVCWYSFGVTHFVRPEDWPVMPVEYAGFVLSPIGFFDRNPALDVPPSHAGHHEADPASA
jgi:primary-amine oxidase